MSELEAPMLGDNCRAELFSEPYRLPLKAACAEDGEIWQIYSINFGPPDFDATIDECLHLRQNVDFLLNAQQVRAQLGIGRMDRDVLRREALLDGESLRTPVSV